MTQPAYKLRSPTDSLAISDPAWLDEIVPGARAPGNEPYRYGWRPRWETLPDGSRKLREIPLTYEDTLDPQLGDRLSEDTMHATLTEDVAGILKGRSEEDLAVAVWRNLKVLLPSPRKGSGRTPDKDAPEGAKGPAPDVCVVAGVRDRDRRRTSFRYGEEPGEIRLAVEVVSKDSTQKDYKDVLGRYARLQVAEYVAIEAKGSYLDGPFEVRGWRYDKAAKVMSPLPADPAGRVYSETTGLLFGPGPGGRGFEIRDAATGELLLPPAQAWRAAEKRAEREAQRAEQEAQRAEQEAQRADQETAARQKAEKRAKQETAGKQKAEAELERESQVRLRAEEHIREILAENERLKGQLGKTREGDDG